MLDSKDFEMKKREDIWEALNAVRMDLLDPYRAYDEISQTSLRLEFADHFSVSEEDLDAFDWTGIKFANYNDDKHDYMMINSKGEEKSLNWAEICQAVESAIAAGYLWDLEPIEYDFIPLVNPIYSRMFRTNRRDSRQDANKLLRQWERMPSNLVDILNPDDNVFEASHRVVNNFEMNVPLKIYSQDEEFVIKADLPDIVFNNTTEELVFPEHLNFKSVLAMLPDRINTRQLQPTFIDGQFRLELPKREEQKNKKVK